MTGEEVKETKEQQELNQETKEQEPEISYKTIVLTGIGGYDKLKVEVKKGAPTLKSGEILVRVQACGLNFSDLLIRQGTISKHSSVGSECAGVVEAIGDDVTDRKVGDKVIVMNVDGGLWAELVATTVNHTFLMPDGMSFQDAAAISVNYVVAYMMIYDYANLRPNQSILIHMAAGGVGVAATQLSKLVKDVTIFGTASASKHEAIKENGVTHPIDYTTLDYAEEVRKIAPKGVDVVLDPLGGADNSKGFGLLKPLGKLVLYGAANLLTAPKRSPIATAKVWWHKFNIDAVQLMNSNKAVCGYQLGRADPEQVAEVIGKLILLYAEGKIKPKVDSQWSFEQVGDAMKHMQEHKNIGKIILVPEVKTTDATTEN
ncbi:synaptic vesicle membrane protein VAT-1 homolog [Pristis pectinata]|uniref:synaptic vesicle membrane protein VAT-1 homolog n=1 Tax=Pristis pectinata TaxID=685728 RepID=UPI00223D51FC|nr:synaptic vesicle membrane protein VAT-1 homolog [Pristis pectinata]